MRPACAGDYKRGHGQYQKRSHPDKDTSAEGNRAVVTRVSQYLARPDAQKRRGGKSESWTGQGMRFGVAVALLTVVPTYMIYFAVQPTPASLAVKQAIFDGVLLLVLGQLVAWWYREGAAERER